MVHSTNVGNEICDRKALYPESGRANSREIWLSCVRGQIGILPSDGSAQLIIERM
jgi:hypothetical protein